MVSPAGNVERLELGTNQETQGLSQQPGPADWAELGANDDVPDRGRMSEVGTANVEPEEWLDGESGLAEAITDIAEDVLSAWQRG